MNQHIYNVWRSKQAAKQDIAAMFLPTLGVTALFLLPAALIFAVFALVCGTDMDAIRQLSDRQLLTCLGVYLLAQLLIVQPLYYGLMQFYALLRGGVRPSMCAVMLCLASFDQYARALRLSLSILLFAVLWAIPLAVACGAGCALYAVVLPNGFGMFLCIEIILLALTAYIAKIMQYHCAYSLMIERPDLSCWKAVRLCADTFRGHNRAMFRLTASFLLWFLVTIWFGGVPLIFVCPYFLLSVFHLFDRVRGIRIKIVED